MMQIKVMYNNNRYGFVEAASLDQLIVKRKIKKFLRSEGWVVIDRDPVRALNREFSDNKKRG